MSKLDEIESYLSKSVIEAVDGCDGLYVCAECGDEYYLRDGCEPTPCCDDCSHTLVFRLRQDAEYLVRRCEALEKALRGLCDSMVPHPKEHPTMFAAKSEAERVLKQE